MAGKIIVMPDSFKGSMTSGEAAEIIQRQIKKYTDKEVCLLPIADGGEGSIDCILSVTGGEKYAAVVKSPEWKDITAHYGITPDGKAVIEIAESSGLTRQTSFAAGAATSYGFGQLILDAAGRGSRDFILCLGGSATTDGACGMAAALGMRFLDGSGNSFIPVGDTLIDIADIDLDSVESVIRECRFEVMCDVENPLYGKNGAAFVYAGQKGADDKQKEQLDAGLRNLCRVLSREMGVDFAALKGGGAAGGAGCGCVAFLGAELKSGIEVLLDLCGFDREAAGAHLIVTGEGKLDKQSLMGKALSGIRRRAGNVDIVSFCGICELTEQELAAHGIRAVEISRGQPAEQAMKNGRINLEKACEDFFNDSYFNTTEG